MSDPLPARTGVVVVGGGQAGLSMSWHLTRRGVDHVVLERHTLAHEWRTARWDTFCLVTPNWQCDLPGFPYAGPDPDGFMLRGEIVAYLEAYAASFGPPLHEGVAVTNVRRSAEGTFVVSTDQGAVDAAAVVVATGGYHRPIVPRSAERLPGRVHQLHSSDYKRPGQLPGGAVLVVGSAQSGAQIAEDLHRAGRRVHLAVGSAPRCARTYRGRDVVAWLADMGQYDVPITAHPLGDAAAHRTNHYVTGRDGGRDIDLRSFARDGMVLHGRLTGIDGPLVHLGGGLRADLDAADAVYDGINAAIDAHIADRGLVPDVGPSRYVPVWQPTSDGPTTLDLDAAGVTTVIWAIGFHPDHSWLEVPVFDGRGRPRHERGVTGVAGLHFLGLPWLHTWGSGRFSAVGRDAAHLADVIGGTRAATLRPTG